MTRLSKRPKIKQRSDEEGTEAGCQDSKETAFCMPNGSNVGIDMPKGARIGLLAGVADVVVVLSFG